MYPSVQCFEVKTPTRSYPCLNSFARLDEMDVSEDETSYSIVVSSSLKKISSRYCHKLQDATQEIQRINPLNGCFGNSTMLHTWFHSFLAAGIRYPNSSRISRVN